MRVVERPFSEFLRQPNEVVAELEEHDVVLRRRNAPSLRLSDTSRDDERAQAFDALARLLRNLLVHSPAGLAEAVDDVFPWATLLPKPRSGDVRRRTGPHSVAASALDSYAPVAQLLQEWRATAEVHADPRLARRLRTAIAADGDPVVAPEA